MRRRFYQMSKFLALVVFSFEMLAPVFVTGAAIYKRETNARILNATRTQHELCSLIAEELGVNEEDDEGQKELPPLDFDAATVFNLNRVESPTNPCACVQHTSGIARHRPLFLLNQLLLI